MEERKGINDVGLVTIPQNVFSDGVQNVVLRRLKRVPDDARAILRYCALIGRQFDIGLLPLIDSELDVDDWLTLCSDAAIIDFHEDSWRFAHDKLREEVMSQVSDDERVKLHEQIAKAGESLYGDAPQYASFLAFQFREAKNVEREAHYSYIVGEQALASGAYLEATEIWQRCDALYEQIADESNRLRRAQLSNNLCNLYLDQGILDQSRAYGHKTLELCGFPMPESTPATGLRTANAAIKQLVRLFTGRSSRIRSAPPEHQPYVLIAAQTHSALGECEYYVNAVLLMLYHAIVGLNIAEEGDDRLVSLRGRLYAQMAVMGVQTRWHELYHRYTRLAEADLPDVDRPSISYITMVLSVADYGVANWKAAWEHAQTCCRIANEIGDMRRWQDGALVVAEWHMYHAQWKECLEVYKEIYAISSREGFFLGQLSSFVLSAQTYLEMGDFDSAQKKVDESLAAMENFQSVIHEITLHGVASMMHVYQDNLEAARPYAEKAYEIISTIGTPTAAHIMEGYTGAIVYHLRMYEETQLPEHLETAKKVHRLLNAVANVYIIARPAYLIKQSWIYALEGKLDKAQASSEEAIELGHKLEMPYQEGKAYYFAARHLPAGHEKRQRYLKQAHEIFDRIGAKFYLERINKLLNA